MSILWQINNCFVDVKLSIRIRRSVGEGEEKMEKEEMEKMEVEMMEMEKKNCFHPLAF